MKDFYAKELNKFTEDSIRYFKVDFQHIGKDWSTGIHSGVFPGISIKQMSEMIERFGVARIDDNKNLNPIYVKILKVEDAGIMYNKAA